MPATLAEEPSVPFGRPEIHGTHQESSSGRSDAAFEHKLEYIGHARKWDQFAVRGSLGERKFVGFYLQAGKLRAAVGLNRDGGSPDRERRAAITDGARGRKGKP